ncbi:MAG TPA: winged helix-turn-helix domain-containing protein [Arthrobacter sp.]|jgi:DNA-binding winged helix-turn-helix (wHTH) protein
MDYRRRTATVGRIAVELTRSGFELLRELLRGAGAVISRSELVRAIRGGEGEGAFTKDADERGVEKHIGDLRRKLGDDPGSPSLVAARPRSRLTVDCGKVTTAGRPVLGWWRLRRGRQLSVGPYVPEL